MDEQRLWELVDALSRARPFRRGAVEALLSTPLAETSRTPHFVRYEARRPGENAHGVAIQRIELRIDERDERVPGFVSIELAGPGPSRAALTARYPGGTFDAPRPGPRGLSPDAREVYWVSRDGGRIAFGLGRDTGLVAGVAFHGA